MGTNLLVGHTGAYQDPVTGGYLLGNGYRMYLPELMRFNSPDSWSPFGQGGIHLYAYCEADPINHADSSGHFGALAFLGILSTLVDAMVAEEAANVAARVLVDEVAADGGLAAASAARAGSAISGTAERDAEETADLVPAAKRPRFEGPGEPGTSQPTASQLGRVWRPFDWDASTPAPSKPIENIRQPAHAPISYVDVCTDLELTEHEVNLMTADLNRVFGGGNLRDRSLRERWMWRDFRGGRQRARRTDAAGDLNIIGGNFIIARRRLSDIRQLLRPPNEGREFLPQEHWNLYQQAFDLRTRIEQLEYRMSVDRRMLDEFERRRIP